MKQLFHSAVCWLAVNIVPDSWKLLGSERFCHWYRSNGYFLFSIGTTIELKDRRIFGYGCAPKGRVVGYVSDLSTHEEHYVIEMEHYEDNWFQWSETGQVMPGARMICEVQRHFKWNIEHQFMNMERMPGMLDHLTSRLARKDIRKDGDDVLCVVAG